MAYHDRPDHLRNTLQSCAYYYTGPSVEPFVQPALEIVIVDDSSPDKASLPALCAEFKRFDFKLEYLDRRDKRPRGPGVVYNRAAELADGDLFLIQNPENMHCGPILKHAQANGGDGKYLVYGCRTLHSKPHSFLDGLQNLDNLTHWDVARGWYQHSVHYNRLLHFCSCISANDYRSLGGFDPIYDDGVDFEDNDFIERILQSHIKVEAIDDPFCAHQNHGRAHLSLPIEYHNRNREIFKARFGRGPQEHVQLG